jgi:hypothetical protein
MLASASGAAVFPAAAHNNPSFKEVHLLTLEVPRRHSSGAAGQAPEL